MMSEIGCEVAGRRHEFIRKGGASQRPRPRFDAHAFTLIELSIVVFIMAVMVAISIPSFVRSYNTTVLSETARKLATTCQFARLNAVLQQQKAVMHINLDQRTVWVSQTVRDEFGEDRENDLKVIPISNRITLVSAQHADEPPVKEGQLDVTFYPNGTCDAASLVFHGADKTEGLMLMIDPVIAKGTTYPVKL